MPALYTWNSVVIVGEFAENSRTMFRKDVLHANLPARLPCCFSSRLPFAADSKNVPTRAAMKPCRPCFTRPREKVHFPALVVIHEWWGLNDWVKEQASKLADQGYVALAIDLYRGKVATTPDQAHEIMRGVPEDRAQTRPACGLRISRSRSPT